MFWACGIMRGETGRDRSQGMDHRIDNQPLYLDGGRLLPTDIKIVDLGEESRARLLDLLWRLASGPAAAWSRNTLIVVYRGLTLISAMDLSAMVTVDVDWRGTSRLGMLARDSGFDRVLAVEETALALIFDHARR